MPQLITTLRQQPAWIALMIVIFLCLWVTSGYITAEPKSVDSSAGKTVIPKVRVQTLYAQKVNREVSLYGRTEPDRSATLRAEVKGLVTAIYVQEGQGVKQGQLILSLDSNDLSAQMRSARAVLQQREIELQGAESLGKKGFQSQSALAQAQANVELAKAEIERLQLALDKTQILAPFDGILNQRNVEVGDLLRDGDTIATVVDLDPLIISADVTENWIQYLQVGQPATGRLTTGQNTRGHIRYLSSVSNMGTNTFNLEVAVPNPEGRLFAGMSTELKVPIEERWALNITPAVMALDEQGNLGVKTVENNVVKFTPIDIVKSDSQGVWLTGLGEQAHVITRGHGFVRHGDTVDVVHDTLSSELKTGKSDTQ